MPSSWYSARDNIVKDDDNDEIVAQKEFNQKIVAANKPYFMVYVYPSLKTRYNTYVKNNNYGAIMRFAGYDISGIDELRSFEPKTKDMEEYLDYFDKFLPVGKNPCVVNRICWIFEDAFNSYLSKKDIPRQFDYEILKSDTTYSKRDYADVLSVYQDYQREIDNYMKRKRTEKIDSDSYDNERDRFVQSFKRRCEEICSNEEELCNIVLDICYQSEKSKQFAWDVCGDVILKNLLRNNSNRIKFPKRVVDNGEFEYCGEQFVMCEKVIGGEENDYTE